MTTFTFTATAPNGETRVRKSQNLYTHATVRGGKVISFHQSAEIAQRAARKFSGTSIVEVTGCAKSEAFLAERRAARAAEVLAHRDFGLGDRVTAFHLVNGVRHPFTGVLVTVIQPPHGFVEGVVREDDGTETSITLLRIQRA